MKLIDKKYIKNIDWVLLLNVLAIFICGLITLAAATATPFTGDENGIADILSHINWGILGLQTTFLAVGIVGMVLIMAVEYENLGELWKIIYWISVGALLAVLMLGYVSRGTAGWFMIGGRGLQPSEFAKISMIIVMAKIISIKSDPVTGITRYRDTLYVLMYLAIPLGLVMAQPDWGTAFVYISITAGILFMARLSYKIIVTIGAVGAGGAVFAYFFLMEQWQRNRILAFFDPSNPALAEAGANLHVEQSKLVIGSGQLTGKGIFTGGKLSQLGFLAEQQTDFIFSVAAESFGFIGVLVIIILYGALMFRLLHLARTAKTRIGSFMVLGVMFMFLFHIFENIGMCIGLVPVTGIPLPFMSYGGSNMLTNMVAIGLAENVAMRRTPKHTRSVV